MASPDPMALSAEIDELKKSRRSVEKDARKAIHAILNSSESPQKKLEERRKVKKEMKAALASTKNVLREKIRALSS